MDEDFIYKEILPKLPIKSLTRFKSVSKSWSFYISSDSFIADHFHHNSAIESPSHIISEVYQRDKLVYAHSLFLFGPHDSNPIEIDNSDLTKAQSERFNGYWKLCGSSNGLVFIQDRNNLLLWNPATREFKNLPMPIDHHLEYPVHSFGFGKDCNNYKVVRIARQVHKATGIRFEISLFTRNSGCWRKLGVLSDDYELLYNNYNGGVVVGDFIHWPVLSGERPAKGSQFKILSFGLNTDELKLNKTPIFGSDSVYERLHIFNWKDSLGAFVYTGDRREFWLKSGDNWCWNKILVMEKLMSRLPFCGVFRDQFFIGSCKVGEKDILFDPVTKAETTFHFCDEINVIHCLNFQHYIPSLISPSF